MMKKNVMKTVVAMCVSVGMLSGSLTVSAASFPDSNPGNWYFEPVDYISERGIMTGYADGKFGPSDPVARGQFATIMYRAEGSPETAFEAAFPDVTDGTFYSIPAVWSKNAGVITGYANGLFGYGDKITREQLVTILFRYADSKGYDTSNRADLGEFPDYGKVSSFATEAMQWAVGIGLISGDQGQLNPQGTASRAQAATIIQRFHQYAAADAAHAHVWTETTETVWVEDVPAWVETVPVYEEKVYFVCEECDWETADPDADWDHTFNTGHGTLAERRKIQTGTEEIPHDAIGHEETVTKNICTGCGEIQ